MVSIDRLREQYNCASEKVSRGLQSANEQTRKNIADAKRLLYIIENADILLDKLDYEFEKRTKLGKTDITFLFLATALQCARQYLLPNNALKISAKDGDTLMENTLGRAVNTVKPEWEDILFQSVPYDAVKAGIHVNNTEIAGTTHRYRTLGHDPVLGWIFGTANIMTNSLTKYNFETFQVKNMQIIRHYPLGCMGMLEKAVEYSADIKLLGASVARQAIHFGSDFFTKQGLPVPLIATLNNDLARDMLSKWHIDMWSVTKGAALAGLINTLIACIHKLFYDKNMDGSSELYEVRTRKILSYSNLIATTSNAIVVAIGAAAGAATNNPALIKKSMNLLDVGGILVTIRRIIGDKKFMLQIKKEYLINEYKKLLSDK